MPRSGKRDTELLGALLADARTETTAEDIASTTEMFFDAIPGGKLIPIERLHEWGGQPRKFLDEARLEELAASISATGVLEPLVVRRDADRPGQYLVTAGMRRLLAARRVHGSDDPDTRRKVAVLPCVIREVAEPTAFADALVENLVRQDLTRREVMDAVATLKRHYDWSVREIARRTGRDDKDISEMLRVAADAEVASLVADEIITVTAAGPLVERRNIAVRATVLEEIRAGRLRTELQIKGALDRLHRHAAISSRSPSDPEQLTHESAADAAITRQVRDIPHLTITDQGFTGELETGDPAPAVSPSGPAAAAESIPVKAHERRVGASTRAELLARDIITFVNEQPRLDPAALLKLAEARDALSRLIAAEGAG